MCLLLKGDQSSMYFLYLGRNGSLECWKNEILWKYAQETFIYFLPIHLSVPYIEQVHQRQPLLPEFFPNLNPEVLQNEYRAKDLIWIWMKLSELQSFAAKLYKNSENRLQDICNFFHFET